ncbi:O-antigen ligase family protein [Adhaeribacter sp. BT258]|uniref:O-antigen ligase family protein n=1 Tax=Adhaeribacter terrigena TaxID=2793070 RepID=A0ABS1C1S4_9BACT|nr:O-antigen ligase family protein [Adhaeribacter terrigena]MBK0402588.1 O-antigen ligase family protein [Adhaeribacter terrigena]
MKFLKAHLPLPEKVTEQLIFWGFGSLIVGAVCWGVYKNTSVWLGIPAGILLLLLLLTNYRALYYLLIFSLPFSMEFFLPVGGLRMDLPAEPLMLLLTGCFMASLLIGFKPDKRFLSHPLVVLIGATYLWALMVTPFSVDGVKSVKYLLAKVWYIVPFLLLTGSIIRDVKDIKRILWFFLVPLIGLILFSLFKHALKGFAFHAVHRSVTPFFMNHVIYATVVAFFIPYVFTLMQGRKGWVKFFLICCLLIMVVGVGFSYTRASWLSLPIAGLYFLAIRFKLTKLMVAGAYLGAAFAMYFFLNNENYLNYAPKFEKTVFNRDNFGKHLQATYKLEDVSGMERVYRWVAALHMVAEKPFTGTGPSTFYPEYKRYTVKRFRTYVSDNPEKSTVHNYFLLQLAEQGIIGLLLFLTLIGYILILPQTLYHRTKDPETRAVIVGAALCLIIIIFHLTLNELLEVDKIGSFYFISLAFLIKLDIWTKAEKQSEALN